MTSCFRDLFGSLGRKSERRVANDQPRSGSARRTERCKHRSVLRFFLFSVLGVGTVIVLTSATGSAVPPTIHRRSREDAVNRLMSLEASNLQSLAVVQDTHGALTTKIKVDDETWTLVLRRHSLRADDFQVLVQAEPNGELVPVQPPPVRTYRGSVLEVPDALVSASFVDGKLTATIGTRSGIYGILYRYDLNHDFSASSDTSMTAVIPRSSISASALILLLPVGPVLASCMTPLVVPQ